MTRSTIALALAGALLATAPAVAQDHGDHSTPDHSAMATPEGVPDGWLMRFDRASVDPEMADFQPMDPGWHVKTGRAGAAIFWMPDMTATGEYYAGTTYQLFSPRDHAESFGLFLGGQGLDRDDQAYLYFLVRQTGEYLIKRRRGGETEEVVGWTAHSAVPTAPAGEPGPTEYELAVAVGADQVEFMVNGSLVHALPKSQLSTDGVVGLRINHMLDVHVEGLAVDRSM